MSEDQKSDLLYGVKAIADFLGLREKQCRNRIDREIIPSFRVGRSVCARKSSLQKWIDEMERGGSGDNQ